MLNEETKNFIKNHLDDDIHQLAFQLKSFSLKGIDVHFVLNQINLRKKSKNKLPSWYINDDIIYPSSIPLEQSSSEITAKYKASLIQGKTLVDLTGGFGVDFAFISPNFEKGVYVERQNELALIAKYNFHALKLLHVDVISGNSIAYLNELSSVDCIYIDPARRSSKGSKLVLIPDCEPNLLEIQDSLLKKADKILIKLSPMLDVKSTLKYLKNLAEIHVLSVNNECKELLVLMNKNEVEEPIVTCANYYSGIWQTENFRYSQEEKFVPRYAKFVKLYLYEPNSSLLKTGFYKSIAEKYNIEKLHVNSHLYTSSRMIPEFPGRIFEVQAISSMNKKDLKKNLSGIDKANITVRNFPMSVEEIRKKLKIKEGGDIYLFFSTDANEKRILIKAHQLFSFK